MEGQAFRVCMPILLYSPLFSVICPLPEAVCSDFERLSLSSPWVWGTGQNKGRTRERRMIWDTIRVRKRGVQKSKQNRSWERARGLHQEQRFCSHPQVVVADETTAYLFLQHGAKCVLPTGRATLNPISFSQVREEKACPPGQGKVTHSFHWRSSNGTQGTGQSPPKAWSRGWAKMARGAAATSAGNGILGVVWLRKNPLVLIDPLISLPRKFRPKHHPHLPPPTRQ